MKQVNRIVDGATVEAVKKEAEKERKVERDGTLTFPETSFKHKPPQKTVDECLTTLPKEFRNDFKKDVEKVIKEMHKLGFAFGVMESVHSGYRTFAQQNDIDPTKTKAGPGESFHNYGLAVDLGVLQWVDEDGKSYSDFWLGSMDKIKKYSGFSKKVWAKRNEISEGKLHSLSFETIHLQGVAADASGRGVLIKSLNKAAQELGDTKWKYKAGSNKTYECTLRSDATWTNTGTAKQMFNTTALNCTDLQKAKIKKHFEKAETIALTISL